MQGARWNVALSSRSRFTLHHVDARLTVGISRSQEDKSNLPLTAYARRFAFRSRLGTRPKLHTCARHAEVRTCDVRLDSSMAIHRVCRALHMGPAISSPFFRSQIPNRPRLSMSMGCTHRACAATSLQVQRKGGEGVSLIDLGMTGITRISQGVCLAPHYLRCKYDRTDMFVAFGRSIGRGRCGCYTRCATNSTSSEAHTGEKSTFPQRGKSADSLPNWTLSIKLSPRRKGFGEAPI